MFGTAPIIDTFSGTGPLGVNWTTLFGSWSKDEVAMPLGGNNIAYWNAASFGPDCESFLTVIAKPLGSAFLDVYARLVGVGGGIATTSGYGVRLTVSDIGDDSVQLISITSAVPTVLATALKEVGVGDKLGIQCIGSTVRAWHYTSGTWSKLLEVESTLYPGSGYVGMTSSDGVSRMDDFSAGASSDSLPAVPPLTTNHPNILTLARLLS